MHHDYSAVVLDLSPNGIGIIRSLARKGIKVFAYDMEQRYTIGRTNQAACGICPHPVYQESECLNFLTELGKSMNQKAVIYAGSDDFVFLISKYRTVLEPYYFFLMPEHSIIEITLNKKETYQFCVENNIPTAKTFFIDDNDKVDQSIGNLDFPCILKPVYSHLFRKGINKKAIFIENEEQLREAFQAYKQFGELMIQEYIPPSNDSIDDGTYDVGVFFDQGMNRIGSFMGQKLHQFPPHFGTGCLVLSVRDEEVMEAAVQLLEKITFKGLASVEYKRDPRDGQLKMIEINPRLWLWHSLSIPCGVDFAYLFYLSLTGQSPAPTNHQKEGIKWVYLVRYYLSYRMKQGRISCGDWIRGLSGKKVYALFSFRDPLPFIRSFLSHLKNNRGRR